jgi:ABC-2 type transport system permease protein
LRWLLLKDLQILRRSPLLVALLVVYPVVIALLIGLALSRGPERPRVAFLNLVPASQTTLTLGSERIDISKYSKQLFQSIDPVRVRTREQAIDKVRSGDALAALIIPADITQRLATGLQSARVEVIYNGDALKQSFVESTISSKLAEANFALSDKLKQVAAQDVDLLLNGGRFDLLGRTVDVLGLKATKAIIDATARQLPAGSAERAALDRVDRFAGLAVDNLDLSKQALSTISQPVDVKRTLLHGRRTPLDAFAVAVAVTVSLMFVCVLLAAGMLALEREENAFSRLVRGLVSRQALVTEKIVLAAGCSFGVTLVMLVGISAFVGLDYGRFGLWLAALAVGALAFAALGVAIGGLAREVRAASLLAFLLSLPLAFLALVPSGAVAAGLYDVIRVVSAMFPFKPALQAISAALNDTEPGIAGPLAHLAGLTLVFGALARLALRRFA